MRRFIASTRHRIRVARRRVASAVLRLAAAAATFARRARLLERFEHVALREQVGQHDHLGVRVGRVDRQQRNAAAVELGEGLLDRVVLVGPVGQQRARRRCARPARAPLGG